LISETILPGQPIQPVRDVTPRTPGAPSAARQPAAADISFRDLLDESLRTEGGIKFSAHALRRLESRGITLSPADLGAVEEAVSRAAAKGARDSLVLAPTFAMVVNVPSRTVITAFDQQALRENVVTNIDSALFMQ